MPGTSAGAERQDSNLARLRAILPKCDVLLITATQQKYRSARVADELAASAPAHTWFSSRPMPIWTTTSATIGGNVGSTDSPFSLWERGRG